MICKFRLAVCLSAALVALPGLAQEPIASNESAGTVAYIYVTSLPANASTTEIDAYSAAPDGQLTPLTNSPFEYDEGALAADGRHLFAINRSDTDIDTLSIGRGGVIDYVTSTDWAQFTDNCGSPEWLFTDRTGRDLYDMIFDGDCANNGFQAFGVEGGSGALGYVGYANGGAGSFGGANLPLTITGNNRFAFEATNNSCMYYELLGYQRAANGVLSELNSTWTPPAPPSGYRIYITEFLAADPTNHLAAVFQPANPPGCSNVNAQVGSITVDNKGNLSTTSTSANMPATQVTFPSDMKVSPSGRLVAIGGQGGLQVFHFNGGNPPTAYTPLLTTDTISQMFWDNDNHLYAISQASGTLFVFTVTPESYAAAPGSPYTVSAPQSIAIEPETPLLP